MDSTQSNTRADLAALCPLMVLGDLFDGMADAAEPFTGEGRADGSIATAVRQTIANALRANAALLDELSTLSSGETRRVRTTVPGSSPGPSRPAPTRPLVLSGRPGENVAGAFAVQNARAAAVEAAPTFEPFTDETGRIVAVQAHLEPAILVLDPFDEAVVRLEVQIPADPMWAGDLTSAVAVPGLSETVVPVILHVAPDIP